MSDLAEEIFMLRHKPYPVRLWSHYRHLRAYLGAWDAFKCARHLARAHLT